MTCTADNVDLRKPTQHVLKNKIMYLYFAVTFIINHTSTGAFKIIW